VESWRSSPRDLPDGAGPGAANKGPRKGPPGTGRTNRSQAMPEPGFHRLSEAPCPILTVCNITERLQRRKKGLDVCSKGALGTKCRVTPTVGRLDLPNAIDGIKAMMQNLTSSRSQSGPLLSGPSRSKIHGLSHHATAREQGQTDVPTPRDDVLQEGVQAFVDLSIAEANQPHPGPPRDCP
jgi:hypothetical protein